ncbi:Mitochondrial processing peptidase alpha subunit [Carpediemonas membranifera]|uniref:Mitochondrial processing peptidase alpha subunit n=1 Tax=Carpediemonas membranifera TaxID=201153 RepID=A0A8J6BV30_9EUKA|nr:Mitochondrial processing peptidase alpha subunit [Carpediemonas membranifera]|eukprot:KAG9390996.1 Mitochondrial processing peptidase alpha subunit [Carpediemonas membranifera]
MKHDFTKTLANGLKFTYIYSPTELTSIGLGVKAGVRHALDDTWNPGLTSHIMQEVAQQNIAIGAPMKMIGAHDRESIRMSCFVPNAHSASCLDALASSLAPTEGMIDAAIPGARHAATVEAQALLHPQALRQSSTLHAMLGPAVGRIDPLMTQWEPQTAEATLAQFHEHVRPDVSSVVVIGGADPNQLMAKLESLDFGSAPVNADSPLHVPPVGTVLTARIGEPTFTLSWRAGGLGSGDYIPLSVLFRALGSCQRFAAGGPGKGLLAVLPLMGLPAGMVETGAAYHPLSDMGVFEISGQLAQSTGSDDEKLQSAMQAGAAFLGQLGGALTSVPGLFRRAVNQSKSNMLLALEDIAVHLREAVTHSMTADGIYSAPDLAAQLDGLTEEQWSDTVVRMLKGKPMVMLTV